MSRRQCYCELCPCDDLADASDEEGPPLCWNCAIGQHHSCDFFWCPPSHREKNFDA